MHLVISEGLEAYIPLADMVDIGKEVERLQKQVLKLQTEYDSSMKRLSSSKVSSVNSCFLFHVNISPDIFGSLVP